MENVAGAERIHGVDREGGGLLQVLLSSSQSVPCGPRVPARNDGVSLAIFLSASPSSAIPAVACSGSLENTRCDDAVSRPSRSDIARSTSTMTGMPRRRASAQRSVQNSAQRLSVRIASQSLSSSSVSRQLHLPQFRIAERDDGALAAGVDHDVRDRRHQARHVHDVPGLDALMRELVENIAARGFAGVAHRAADRGAAAETDDSDRAVERVAAADFVEMAGVLLGAARRKPGTRKVRSRTGMPMQRMRGGIFGAAAWKFMRFVRHAGSVL